jgi:hypothetical protein
MIVYINDSMAFSFLEFQNSVPIDVTQDFIDNPEKYELVYNANNITGVIAKIPVWTNAWLEPDWNYRIIVTLQQIREIGKLYPQMLLELQQEPKNPIYDFDNYSVIYVNNIDNINLLGLNYETKAS